MQLREALALVRQKFQEERDDVPSVDTVKRYKAAVTKYPVMMQTAVVLWALEIAQPRAGSVRADA